jgi:hypothetical protein
MRHGRAAGQGRARWARGDGHGLDCLFRSREEDDQRATDATALEVWESMRVSFHRVSPGF